MKRISLLSFLAALFSSLIILVLYYQEVPFLEKLEGSALDLMFGMRGQERPASDIAIIAINEKVSGNWCGFSFF